MSTPLRSTRLEYQAGTGVRRARRRRASSPARVTLEHTHIYRVLTEDGGVAGARVGPPAPPRRDACRLSGGRRLGGGRAGAQVRRRAHPRRAAAPQPLLAPRGRRSHRGAGRRGQHRHRVSRRRPRRRFQPAPHRAVSARRVRERRLARHRAQQGRSRGRRGRPWQRRCATLPGVPVHVVSCHVPGTSTCCGSTSATDRPAALLGSSGVGKSTIVNRSIGHDLLRTRDVRESDSRGRHTSTARQLIVLPGSGVLIDTPGMRELQLWDTGEAMGATFADIEALANGCRFRDCRHRQEPGCAVRGAVDGRAACARTSRELSQAAGRAGAPGAAGRRARADREKRRWKVLTKAAHKRMKEKGRD